MTLDQMIAKLTKHRRHHTKNPPISRPFFEPRIVLTAVEAEEIAEKLHRLKDLEK